MDLEVVLDLINGIGDRQGVMRGECGTEAVRYRAMAGIDLVWDAVAVKPAC